MGYFYKLIQELCEACIEVFEEDEEECELCRNEFPLFNRNDC